MKNKFVLLLLGVVTFVNGFSQGNNGNTPADTNAQSNTRWKLDGNNLSSDKFIGTLNQKDLIFKSNNIEGLRIKPNKDFKIPGQIYIDLHRPLDPGKEKLLIVDYNGKVTSMEKSGLLDVLYDPSPCYMKAGNLEPEWAYLPGVIWTGGVCAPARVGIGTDNPRAQLEVVKAAYFGNSINISSPLTSTDAKLNIKQPLPHRSGLIINMSNTGSANFSGVGIQTIVGNPLRKAMTVVDGVTNEDVFRVFGNGLIEAKKLRLSLNIWSDFVFEEDYKLMSLDSLNKFIETNNHLPNVPSENEMIDKGLDVAEMDALLLQKIEELTLYMLELNKEVQELKKKNLALNAVIESNK